MKKRMMMMGLGLLGMALPAPTQAWNQSGTLTLDPFAGAVLLPGQHRNNASLYGLRIGYNFTDNLAAEAMFGYFATEDWDHAFARDNRMVHTYRLGGDALYHINPEGRFVPFLAVGGGWLKFDNPDWADQSHGLFDYGAGFKWFLADFVALRGDARHVLFREAGDINSGIELTAGLSFMLGGEKRPVDSPYPTAMVVEPKVICTSPDAGASGVAVGRDVIATFNVPVERSAISGSAFTVTAGDDPVEGSIRFDGDNAAIFNPKRDLQMGTKYTATVAAGVNGAAGGTSSQPHTWRFTTVLPPEGAAPAVLIMLEDNHFEFDKSVVTAKGAEILGDNIKLLKANPDVRIRIAGYTSAKGTAEYNQKLSERRAQSVKAYLVKGGIAADRLVTIGFGQTRPAEYEPLPNNIYSKEAKANMRVLFEVIVK